jgi:hypothetical protein
VNGFETLLSFLIRTTIDGDTQLFNGAIFRIRELTRTTGASSFKRL